MFVYVTPTTTSDRGCTDFTVCRADQYEFVTPQSPTRDRECRPLTYCPSRKVEINAPPNGVYEQNRPNQYLYEPVGQSRSLSVHESQSLFYENHIFKSHSYFLNFSEIDTDQNNQITFQQLYDKYLDILSPLPIDHYYPSKIFIDLIKSDNNLTNESSITLEQLLTYENQHNVTRYWPL